MNLGSYIINKIERFELGFKVENLQSKMREKRILKHIVLDYIPNKTLDYYFSKSIDSIKPIILYFLIIYFYYFFK